MMTRSREIRMTAQSPVTGRFKLAACDAADVDADVAAARTTFESDADGAASYDEETSGAASDTRTLRGSDLCTSYPGAPRDCRPTSRTSGGFIDDRHTRVVHWSTSQSRTDRGHDLRERYRGPCQAHGKYWSE